MAGGEGPWTGPGLKVVSPGVLVAGTNCVTTDAVAMAVMGYDPMADRGTPPFEKCDSTLRLAEELGVGTRDLKRIEVVGTPVDGEAASELEPDTSTDVQRQQIGEFMAENGAADKPIQTFESCLEELEKVVKELESGDLPLERSLELFEKGMALQRIVPQATRRRRNAASRRWCARTARSGRACSGRPEFVNARVFYLL